MRRSRNLALKDAGAADDYCENFVTPAFCAVRAFRLPQPLPDAERAGRSRPAPLLSHPAHCADGHRYFSHQMSLRRCLSPANQRVGR